MALIRLLSNMYSTPSPQALAQYASLMQSARIAPAMSSFSAQQAANSSNFEAVPAGEFSYQRRSSTADRSHLRDFNESLAADKSGLPEFGF